MAFRFIESTNMFTIERALLIDFWRRGRWSFLTTFVCAASLLLLVFGAIQSEGGFDYGSLEAVQIHVPFSMALGFCIIAFGFGAQGKVSRFFVRPIGTSRLVLCQLTFAMGAVAGLYLALAGLMNLVFAANWPLWGPAFFFAAAMACAQAAIWWTEGVQAAQIVFCTATAVPLAIWYSRRYGATVIGDWHTMWSSPTVGELGTLAAITIGAYVAAIYGVARIRRGDGLDFTSVTAWFAARFGSSPRRLEKFRSAWHAQLWYEWRQKLGGAPALIGLVILAMLILRLVGAINSQDMLGGMFTLSLMGLLILLPFVYGLVVGNCGAPHGLYGMSSFQATRPLTDSALASAALRTGALAILLAWVVWVAGMAAGALLCFKLDGTLDMRLGDLPSPVPWLYLWIVVVPLAVLVMSWANLGLVVSVTMAGRPYLLGIIFGGIWISAVAFLYAANTLFPAAQAEIQQIGLAGAALLLLGVSIWIVVRTRRRQLVPERTTWLVVAAWVGLTTIGISLCVAAGQTQFGWLLQIAGTSALAVLPFVAAPLALAWNRHR